MIWNENFTYLHRVEEIIHFRTNNGWASDVRAVSNKKEDMNIYLVKRIHGGGYDSYDSFVAAAQSEDDAMTIHPSLSVTHHKDGIWIRRNNNGDEYKENDGSSWVPYAKISDETVEVSYIGKTNKPRGVILASFNAA